MEVKDELFDVIHPLSDGKNRNCLALNRARRKIKKKELHYCDQCRMDYDSECPLHQPVLMHIGKKHAFKYQDYYRFLDL